MVVVGGLFCLPASAGAAWSAPSQVTGYLGSSFGAAIDDEGTAHIGVSASTAPAPAGGSGIYELTRAAGSSTWSPVKIAPLVNDVSFAFAANGAATATWEGAQESGKDTVWAAYRPAGGAWVAPVKVSTPDRVWSGPVAAISADGAATTVAMTGPAVGGPDQISYSTSSNGTWSPASDLATVQQSLSAGTTACNVTLFAGTSPNGSPIAAWSDYYGSAKYGTGLNQEKALCGVRIATTSGTNDVTPRPSIGWAATPGGALPSWDLRNFSADPDTGAVALGILGRTDYITTDGGTCGGDPACQKSPQEAHALLGSPAGVTGTGTNLADSGLTSLAARDGRLALAVRGPSNPLAAGIGTSVPSRSPLSADVALQTASMALGPDGEATLAVGDGSTVRTFDAEAGGGFGAATTIGTSSTSRISASINCRHERFLAWIRTAPGGIFTSDDASGSSDCSDTPDPPSNHFTVGKVNGTKLTLTVEAPGAAAVSQAAGKPKDTKLLKPSKGSGGPGALTVSLKLTSAGKKQLKKKGKLSIKSTISFTPTGGEKATTSKTLKLKK